VLKVRGLDGSPIRRCCKESSHEVRRAKRHDAVVLKEGTPSWRRSDEYSRSSLQRSTRRTCAGESVTLAPEHALPPVAATTERSATDDSADDDTEVGLRAVTKMAGERSSIGLRAWRMTRTPLHASPAACV
jgi:hypothetical protein